MKKITQIGLTSALVAGVVLTSASSVLAFDGQFTNKQNSSTGFRQNLKKRMGGLMNGGGGLVPE
ncbi:MAG: hypothetical protein U9O78_04060, partial [Patescibacteria group bacterium]|nr:hypothetical protein [Patescibacteria group bacterium]